MSKLKTYEILSGGCWENVKGSVTPRGWLDWHDPKDNSVGLTRPGKFREVQSKAPERDEAPTHDVSARWDGGLHNRPHDEHNCQ